MDITYLIDEHDEGIKPKGLNKAKKNKKMKMMRMKGTENSSTWNVVGGGSTNR